jgi:cellulose biosynthesis protein BcsQ
MTILTLANSKGGGGKTTIAACLAAELTRRGKELVLLDADPQRSLTVWHGNDGKFNELELHTDPNADVNQHRKGKTYGSEIKRKSFY